MVYRGGGEVREGEPLLREDCLGYVVEEAGQIVGAATVLDLTCSVEGHNLRCAGVAAVGVLPNLRRGGAGTALMAGMMPLLRQEGFALTSLYAYRETFYRRVGYEVCGGRKRITCPSHRLPKVESELETRTIPIQEIAALEPVLQANALRYNGFSLRTPAQWWRATGGDSPFTIFVAGDPVDAYALVRLRTDFWGEQEVQEVAWSTEQGHKAMLQLFRSLTMNHSAIVWNEPPDSPTWYRYRDQGMEATQYRPIMFRVLDAQACLAARAGEALVAPGISVKDDLIPENNVSFGENPLDLSIQEFTQAVLGQPSLASIAAYRGRLGETSGFPSRPVYCQDFF